MAYQPLLGLSWHYTNSTGALKIIATIRIELDANEALSVAVSSIVRETALITINIISGTNNSPMTRDIPYTNIGSGLANETTVRSVIAQLPAITVRMTVSEGGTLRNEHIGTTSSNSELTIV